MRNLRIDMRCTRPPEHWFKNEAADGCVLVAFGAPGDGQRFLAEVLPLLQGHAVPA